MNVQVSYRADRTAELESEINQQVEKLGRRLRVFRPDLVSLHVNVEPGSSKRNGGISASVNLRLPSDQLTATALGSQATAVIKNVFKELTTQLDAHKDHLRNRRNFNRKTAPQVHGVPFETTLAAVKVPEPNPEATLGDIRLFINTNMGNLERFIRRQIRLRLAARDISPYDVTVEEVLDETVASALDNHEHHPDLMSIEQWLYKLALEAVDQVARRNASTGDVHIEEPGGTQNVRATDDEYQQFNMPDDQLFVSDFIPDETRSNPEQVVYSRESIEQVGGALACLDQNDRDIFVLFALEGFSISEIVHIAGRPEKEVKESLQHARTALQKNLSPDNAYRNLISEAAA